MSVQTLTFDPGRWNFRDKVNGFVASAVFHLVLLTAGGVILIKPVEYGVDAGLGGVEIHLVAAPAPVVSDVQPAPEFIVEEKESVLSQPKDDVIFPEPAKIVTPRITIEKKKEPVLTSQDISKQGDGSSPVPGAHETTARTSGGAMTQAKPNYLSNPAPAYPWEAKRKGWQGVVLLNVSVDKNGNVSRAAIERSSGFSLLDAAALRAVLKWKFRPALLGDIPIETSIRVPVRFSLFS